MTERQDLIRIAPRRADQPVAVRRVVRHDRNAARLQAFEDFALGVRDRLFGAEVLDMRRRNRGDEREMRTDHARQRGDLAFVVHAHFEHREVRLAGHPGKAQRNARMVVVALDGAVSLAAADAVEHRVERFLGAGLADRTGDADDAGRRPFARSPAEVLERSCRVLDQYVRTLDRLRHDCPCGPCREGSGDELVTVMNRARHGNEQVARLHFAAVEGDAGDFEGSACTTAGRRLDLGRGPQRAHAAHSRATSASSNGSTRWFAPAPMICPVSWPLPASRMMSPSPAIRMASAMASRRPPISIAPGDPAMTSARIFAGSSPRGLSSVTMTTSDSRDAAAPISGRFPWSRSPPAPKTVIRRLPTWGRSAAMAASSASAVWA